MHIADMDVPEVDEKNPPPEPGSVRLDAMKDNIGLLRGWHDPEDLDRFFDGDL
jgi:hypothetical protein